MRSKLESSKVIVAASSEDILLYRHPRLIGRCVRPVSSIEWWAISRGETVATVTMALLVLRDFLRSIAIYLDSWDLAQQTSMTP